MHQSKDMAIRMRLGEAEINILAEGVSWSPDVASDMTTRLLSSMRELVTMANEIGIPVPGDDFDDFDDEELTEEVGDDGSIDWQ